MNRYTQISPSQFQPLSLQEIMLVPTLKRQQHDAALAGMGQLRDLQADPLKVHEDRALQIKSDFENKINEKVEQLNSQGYNPSIVSELSRLNKEYKDLISPTGEIGKINQAKQIRNQMYDQWLKNKDYDKYGSDVMQRHWQDFEGTYTGFDSEGNITNIGAMSSPVYEDLDEDLKTRFKGIGHIARDIMSGGIGLSPQADGSMLIVNSKTGEKSKVNDPQIQAELNDFYLKWVDPRGSGYKSLTFAGVDPNYAYQRAIQKGAAATIDEYGRTNIQTGSLQGFKRNDDKDTYGGEIFTGSYNTSAKDLGLTNYQQALKILENKSQYDPSYVVQVQNFVDQAKGMLNNNPAYLEAKKALENVYSEEDRKILKEEDDKIEKKYGIRPSDYTILPGTEDNKMPTYIDKNGKDLSLMLNRIVHEQHVGSTTGHNRSSRVRDKKVQKEKELKQIENNTFSKQTTIDDYNKFQGYNEASINRQKAVTQNIIGEKFSSVEGITELANRGLFTKIGDKHYNGTIQKGRIEALKDLKEKFTNEGWTDVKITKDVGYTQNQASTGMPGSQIQISYKTKKGEDKTLTLHYASDEYYNPKTGNPTVSGGLYNNQRQLGAAELAESLEFSAMENLFNRKYNELKNNLPQNEYVSYGNDAGAYLGYSLGEKGSQYIEALRQKQVIDFVNQLYSSEQEYYDDLKKNNPSEFEKALEEMFEFAEKATKTTPIINKE